MRWTPIFGRPDKVELPGWEAPYQEQDDGREAASIWGSLQGEGGFGSHTAVTGAAKPAKFLLTSSTAYGVVIKRQSRVDAR